MVIKLAEANLHTRYGIFQEHLYYDGQKESIAFTMGDLKGAENVLCRVHSSCIYGHYFNSTECDCQEQMDISQQLIQKAGIGILILLEQEGKGTGHLALIRSIQHKREGIPQAEAYVKAGYERDARNFRVAAKILQDLGVGSIRMLTNNPQKVETVAQHGIQVLGTQEIRLD
ncbi:MAG: GTP cyclohydrolase [Bacteroidota bacterium]